MEILYEASLQDSNGEKYVNATALRKGKLTDLQANVILIPLARTS